MSAADLIEIEGLLDPEPHGELGHVEPGIYSFIPAADYHRSPGISKHKLDILRQQSPAHLREIEQHPRPETAAQRLGTAFHCLVLEPGAFPEQYVALPADAPNRPTERQRGAKKPSPATLAAIDWWDSWEAEHGNKVALSTEPGTDPHWNPSEWDQIHRMRDAVEASPYASTFLAEGIAEQSVYARDPETGLLMRCRPDFWSSAHDVIVDLKMARDASLAGFARACADFRYHVQDAFYLDCNYYAGRTARGFIFVACEPAPPYAVGVYALPAKWRNVARAMYTQELRVYAQCLESGTWPAYPPEIRDLELPPWAERAQIR